MLNRSIKSIRVFMLSITLVMVCGCAAFAAYTNWTRYENSTIDSDTSTTSNHYSVRYTTDIKFGVYVKDKTMWSSPTARIVNSNGQNRSSNVTLSSTGEYLYGSGNTCEKNHKYWLKISPAWNQIGTDTINYKFSVR